MNRKIILLTVSVAVLGSVFAEQKWTYEGGVLKEVQSESSGSTLWEFYLSEDGALSKKTYGDGKVLDFRATALPEGAVVKTVSADTLAKGNGGNATVTDVFMGESLTSIPQYFAYSFTALTNVVWSPVLASMGTAPFKGCTKMRSDIVIPATITTIPKMAFQNCSAVKNVILHDGIRTIVSEAFSGCSSITNVTPFLPRSLSSLGASAFYGCSNLQTPLELGFGTNDVGEAITVSLDTAGFNYAWTFRDCSKLPSIKYGPGILNNTPWQFTRNSLKIGFIEFGPNINTVWEGLGSYGKSSLSNVVVKYTGTFAFPPELGNRSSTQGSCHGNAFYGLTGVREITWSGYFTYAATLEANPFRGWNQRQARFIVPGDNLEWNAFAADPAKLTPFKQLDQSLQDEYYAKYGNDAKEPKGLSVSVNNGLPATWIVMTDAKIAGQPLQIAEPNPAFGSITCSPAIPESGLYEDGQVVTVTFTPAAGVTFGGWTGTVPEEDRGKLSIELTMDEPKSLGVTFESSFWAYENGQLTDGSWTLGATASDDELTVKSVVAMPADGKLDLSRQVLGGKTVVAIGDSAFNEQTGLTEVRLPSTLRSIGSQSFYKCTALKTVTPFFPDSLTYLGYAAFAQCGSLTGNLRIGFGIGAEGQPLNVSFGTEKHFNGSGKIGPCVEFGPGVTYIPASMMPNARLTNIVLGVNVAIIGNAAFDSVANTSYSQDMCDVTFLGDMPQMPAGAFHAGTTRTPYMLRVFFSTARHPKWREFVSNADKVAPRKDLTVAELNEYESRFPRTAGNRRPDGLTLAGAEAATPGLRKQSWLIRTNRDGLALILR